jgi:hypothetical protein
LDLGFIVECVSRATEETIGWLNYTAQNADHFALFENSPQCHHVSDFILSCASANLKLRRLNYLQIMCDFGTFSSDWTLQQLISNLKNETCANAAPAIKVNTHFLLSWKF